MSILGTVVCFRQATTLSHVLFPLNYQEVISQQEVDGSCWIVSADIIKLHYLHIQIISVHSDDMEFKY